MRQTTTPNTPAEQQPAPDRLAISDALQAVKNDWLYQLCGPIGRSRLIAENVPLPDHIQPVLAH
jgi:hypothetical protein